MSSLFHFQDVNAPRCAFYGSENNAKFLQFICCVPTQINNEICKSVSCEQYVWTSFLSFNTFVSVYHLLRDPIILTLKTYISLQSQIIQRFSQ
jgi:hypothetical protein